MIYNRRASGTLRVESDLFDTRRLPFPHFLEPCLGRSLLETNPDLYAGRQLDTFLQSSKKHVVTEIDSIAAFQPILKALSHNGIEQNKMAIPESIRRLCIIVNSDGAGVGRVASSLV